MAQDIAYGSKINIKVVNEPTSRAARKTIQRLLAKDADVAAEHARQKRLRKVHHNPKMRGGRLYGGRLVKQHPIHGTTGESGTITATPEVIRSLGSIRRFVQITTG